MKIFIEVDIKGHIIIETLVVHSLADSKIVKMVLNQDDHDNSYNQDDIFNTAEKMNIVDTVKRDSGLFGGIKKCSFTTEQEIIIICKIKKRLLRQNLFLMG